MRNTKVRTLCECAMMVALAFALSYAKIFEMPLGGSVTICSMLPIMLIGIKYGPVIGLGTGFVYSITQLLQGLAAGNVFPYLYTWQAVVMCILFDYILPFTIIGLAGVFGKKGIMPYVGMFVSAAARLLCHLVSGATIWTAWQDYMPEGFNNVWVYSISYNGSFLLPDFAICLAAAIVLLNVPQMRKLVGLTPRGTMAAEQPASDAQRDSDDENN